MTIVRDFSIFVGAVNEFDPQLTSPLALSVAENTLSVAQLTATDNDSPTPSFTYSIAGGADAAQFTISGDRLSFAAAPNFEAPLDADGNNQYVVDITVSDGSRSQTRTLVASVTNINEAPTNIALSNLTFAESLPAGSVVGTLSATDTDGPLPITFAFVSSANDNGDFEIVGNQLRTLREFDYETLADQELSIQLVARDGLNAASALSTLNLSVTDGPERPIANDLTLSTNRNIALPLTLGGDAVSPTFTITQHPSKGTLTGTAPNLTYTPNTNIVGDDEFFYTISNDGQTSYEARVSISVLNVLPTATFEFAQIGLIESVPDSVWRVRVNLNAPAVTDTVIRLAIASGGTATVDQDFSAPSTVLVRAGESFGVALASIVDDKIDEADETFTFQIVAAPDYLIGSQSAYQVIISDDDAPPEISLEKTSLTLDEANTSTTVRLRLSAVATQDILVPWTLTTQGATLGSDFTLAGGSVFPAGGNYLRIPAGASAAFLTINLTDDTALESLESLKIQFNAPAYGSLKTPTDSAYTLTIRDNDERIISMQRSLVTVGEAAGTYTVTAVANPPFTEATTIPVSFGGSAVSTSIGRDYSVGSPGAFVFGANQTTASLSLTIVDDTTAERAEGIMVALLDNSTSYKLGSIAQTFITINDNDSSFLSFVTASSEPWENAGNQTVSISLTKALSEPITIPLVLTTGAGFATKNTDFRFNTTSLTIPAGQTSASATLEILNDGANEANETIRIAFGTLPANALFSVGTNSSSTIVIRDDDPLLSIRAVNSSVPENGTAEFDLLLSAPTWNGVTAVVSLGGTATFNGDYTRPLNNSFINYTGRPQHLNYPFLAVIPPSVTSLRLRLPIVNDSLAEKPETITAAFSVSGGALQASANTATVSITDDDQYAVAFTTASGNISEAATVKRSGLRLRFNNRQHTVSVEMAQAATRDINVGIVFGGTAKFGVDYKVLDLDAKSGLTIRKGSKTASFRLEIIADSVFEGDETIKAAIVAVTAPGTLVNPASTREFKILDNDKPSASGGFGLWGGEDDLEALARMRAAIVQPNEPLVLSGTLAIFTSPSVGMIPFLTTSIDPLSGTATAVFDINGNVSILPGTIALATGSKGPVEGALAFFDANFNGVLDFVDSDGDGVQDDDELSELPATTAADGSFAFELDDFDTDNNGVDASEGRLVLSGGTDLSTGLVGLIPLTAPIGLFNITPLSTIAESLVRLNQWSVSEAIQRTTQAFGISNYNLAEGVSLYQVLSNDALAAKAYSTHVQIYSVAVGLAEFLAGVSGRDVALLGSLIFDEMASFISTEGSTIDLANPEVISAIAQSVIEKQAIDPVTAENSNAVTSAIVTGILELQKVQLASDGADAGEDFLSSIYKAKKVVQGILPADLHLLGSGNQNAAFINDKYTTTGIAGLVATQTATVIVPPVVGIDSLAIVEGDNGLQNLVFTATLIGKHSYPVSVDYATADATATATADALGDYQAQSGTLTWAANNNDLKYISIPIESDTVFEADEFFRILLGNPSGLVIRQAEGRGFLSNNDLLTLTTSAPASQAANEILVSLSSGQAKVNENGQEVLDGPFLMPVQAEFSGQLDFTDQWTVDFSKNQFRADTWTFDGKAGAADELIVAAGSFTEIEYSILTSSNSSIKLRDESFVGQISLNAVNVESSRLHVSEVNDLIVHIPANISSLVIEDAHISESGRMRIRSTDGAFAPIEFTNPTSSLRIVRESLNTTITVASTDPDFTGQIFALATQVTAATANATGQFTLNMSGSDIGGTQLKFFDVYVAIDNGQFQKVGRSNAGTAESGVFNASFNYQGLVDGLEHTYRFYSVGLNASEVSETIPSVADLSVTKTFIPATTLDGTVGSDNFIFAFSESGITATRNGSSMGSFSIGTQFTVNGLSGVDTLQILGTTGGTAWVVSGPNNATVRTNGSAADQFTLTSIESLRGSDTSPDSFTVTSTGILSGSINGGSGPGDSLTTLSGSGSINWAASTASGVLGGFTDIDIVGGTGGAFTGPNAEATWTLTGPGSGTVAYGNNQSIGFTGYNSLIGGSANDTFLMGTSGLFTGINGGGGTDTLNLSALSNPTINLVNRTATSSGLVQQMENLIGAGTGSTLIGPNLANTWTVIGSNSGSLANSGGTTTFSGFGRVTGGTSTDVFGFSEAGSITGQLSGGSGTNTLSFAGRTTPVRVQGSGSSSSSGSVRLQSNSSQSIVASYSQITTHVGSPATDEFVGANAVSNWTIHATGGTIGSSSFSSYEQLFSGAADDTFTIQALGTVSGINGGGGLDTLIAPNTDNTWTVTGSGAGTLNTLAYSQMENLTGGTGDDLFLMQSGGSVTGRINPGTGINTLSYANRLSSVHVNLSASTPSATNVSRLNDGFSILIGGSGNDTLIGSASRSMVIVGGAGNDTITGGSARDILIGGLGSDTLRGGSGEDIVIGGTIASQNNLQTLKSLQLAWLQPDDQASRRAQLKLIDQALLAETSEDAGAVDKLFGEEGEDWLVGSLEDEFHEGTPPLVS